MEWHLLPSRQHAVFVFSGDQVTKAAGRTMQIGPIVLQITRSAAQCVSDYTDDVRVLPVCYFGHEKSLQAQ